jgi:hypothetical protein
MLNRRFLPAFKLLRQLQSVLSPEGVEFSMPAENPDPLGCYRKPHFSQPSRQFRLFLRRIRTAPGNGG